MEGAMREMGAIADECGMDRRSFFAATLAAGAGIAATSLGSRRASADDAKSGDGHAGHDMEHMGQDHSALALHQELIDVALKCVNRGDVCVNHCLTSLATGDTSLKDCIRSVSAMLPMCSALAKLAALNSSRLRDVAKVCMDICDDCQKECDKHAEHHAACKACAQSCGECIDACKKLT